MAYIVNIQTGNRSNKNFTRTQSTPLPNKEKVRMWVKRNPVGNIKTKVSIKNTTTGKTKITSKAGASVFGWKIK